MWDRQTLQQHQRVFTGHTGFRCGGAQGSAGQLSAVQCSAGQCSTVTVLHLSFNFKYAQFCNGMMVTCSKDRSIAVSGSSWHSPPYLHRICT